MNCWAIFIKYKTVETYEDRLGQAEEKTTYVRRE